MLSPLPLLIAISHPLHVQWNHMSSSNGFIWQTVPQKLIYAVPFNRPALCRPFGFPHHSLPREWGSGWDLGNAKRSRGERPVAGEAHLTLHLSHHLTLRASCCNSQFATDFGKTPLRATWGHGRPLGTHNAVPGWQPLSLLWRLLYSLTT